MFIQPAQRMKLHILSCAFVLAASGMDGVHAEESAAMTDFVRGNGCFSCHSATEKIVGPSFQSISSKYADDKDAVPALVQSIKNGSVGKWSSRVAMPPHQNISNEDLTRLAKWVLSQKP
ncbi:c-type cytochrome [Polaromonas sp.]|uniref:c-type cytochrome n=1 Tax=Polaromonas sp. TaxID=1869339 RepID=UPI003BB636F2